MEFSSVYPSPPKMTSFEEMKAMVDNSSFASHEGIAGRQWHIGLKSVPLLLQAAEKNPEVLRGCEALWIESPDEGDYDEEFLENPEVFAAKCEDLSRLLDITASHGRLQRFEWTWMSGVLDCGQPEVPAQVWTSLAKNGSTLRSLNVTPTAQEYGEPYEASWVAFKFCLREAVLMNGEQEAFSLEGFSALRYLDLGLDRAHGWPGSRLHQTLKALPGLTSLHLRCPSCCGLQDFALASHHPNLRSLTLHATTYPNQVSAGDLKTEDFLKRHPLIEYLDLMYVQDVDPQDGELKLDSEDLPNLRAIDAGSSYQLLNVQLTARQIEAVSFFRLPEPKLLSKLPMNRIKYVHMRLGDPAELKMKSAELAQLLIQLPALTELRLHVPASGWKETFDPMDEQYMITFLEALDSAPNCANSLTALSFVDILGDTQLTQAVLDNLPCKLPSLRYLGWETKDDNKKLYELRRVNGKVAATLIEPLRPVAARKLFVDESILDHFGERAREW
ncbi:hypothetical protein NM688_g3745 [Phlebia brevispora]|uniref:Uncharacterized protein n=1 Tax=Phlebia brevispora TaxID=194682 RepID=A0ACC1T544_9APHY|nr:hypothetical protein NM688_g3745 [Phlebia brevispora]